MTEDGEGYENQIAERMNGILKTEFNLNKIFKSHDEAKSAVAKSIEAYNTKRPHMSIDFLTPDEAHGFEGELQKRWKNNRAKNSI
jgi:transposase InsO family protein